MHGASETGNILAGCLLQRYRPTRLHLLIHGQPSSLWPQGQSQSDTVGQRGVAASHQ